MTPEQQQQFLDLGREVLAQQAFSRLLGAELTRLVPGEAELSLALRDELKQQNGFAPAWWPRWRWR
jgi:acyl-coenzyme A thioesterase PaaI-like protein